MLFRSAVSYSVISICIGIIIFISIESLLSNPSFNRDLPTAGALIQTLGFIIVFRIF